MIPKRNLSPNSEKSLEENNIPWPPTPAKMICTFISFLSWNNGTSCTRGYTNPAVYAEIPVDLDTIRLLIHQERWALKIIGTIPAAITVIGYLHSDRILDARLWITNKTGMSRNNDSNPAIRFL